MKILGIDPGLNKTGFGVIRVDGNRHQLIECGHIQTEEKTLPLKLQEIFSQLQSVIDNFKPNLVSIEKVFIYINADSALKLGQARGCAIAAAVNRKIPVIEYSATQIKSAITGKGHANKEQVQFMVKHILNISTELQEDAADALASALCHAFHLGTQNINVLSRNNGSSKKRKRYDWIS